MPRLREQLSSWLKWTVTYNACWEISVAPEILWVDTASNTCLIMSTKCSKIIMTERKSAQKTSSFVWLDMHLWKENKLLVSFRNRAHFCIEREKNQLIKCLSRKVNEKRSYSSHFTSSILAPFVLCEWSVAVEANDVLSVPWVCVRLSIGEWIYMYSVHICVCMSLWIYRTTFILILSVNVCRIVEQNLLLA